MSSRKPLDRDYEEGEDSSEEDSSTISEVDSTTRNNEDVNVAFLLVDFAQTSMVVFMKGFEHESESPYEVSEEVTQPKNWGIDVIGLLPIMTRQKSYILMAVDYLSRWTEAKAVKQIIANNVAKFVYEEICCKFGVPLELLFDQGPRFTAEFLDYLCQKIKIKRQFTTPYYPLCNGLNERFNVKTRTWSSPFHLVYGKEALLPVEVEMTVVKLLEKLLGPSNDAFKEGLLFIQEVQLDKMNALKQNEQMQDKALAKINEKVKSKDLRKEDFVLRYNSKLDKTF
ncbi:hypothetical protein L7F22_037806 [Adiantum nelumboides]|nr:hypothetical protein [Adiantum nelumboides]